MIAVPAKKTRRPTEAEIREAISGNICRCTGYQNIVEAVKLAAADARMRRSAHDDTLFRPAIKRNEDPRLLTGQALFTDDVHLPGMLHVAFMRSDYAHARISRIDVSAARACPAS